jgi:excisionase family DNA binding protein
VLTQPRVTDKLLSLMESPPEQLSLPLLESDSDDRERQSPLPKEAKRNRGRRVVSGRPLTRPAEASAEPAARSTAPALLTTSEAANVLHVHPRTVQRLVERGELSAVRLGAAVRFDPADVADLTARLKRREAGATTSSTDVVRPSRAAGVSFAERLRSQQDEHRAA